MTATLHIAAIIEAIQEIDIVGLTIYGLSDLPEQVDTRADVALFPDMYQMITNLAVSDVTFGGYNAEKNVTYRINYIFAVNSSQAGRSASDYISDAVDIAEDIIATINTTDLTAAGAVTHTVTCPFIGMVEDPAGNRFVGGKIAVDVLEFIQ